MNKKLKSQLKKAFDAPAPTRKTEFLQSLCFPKASGFDFVVGQIGYIRKRVWTVSCLLVMTALFGLHFFANDNVWSVIWMLSSILPFISLMTVTEIKKSTSCHMAELEMSCKYNFTGIVLARLGILSFFHIMVFGLIILLFLGRSGFGIFRLTIYLLVPFMLTCAISLFVLNRLRSRETTTMCGGVSCFVSIANALFGSQYKIAFSDEYLVIWGWAFFILVIWTIMEIMKLMKKTEELQWNL